MNLPTIKITPRDLPKTTIGNIRCHNVFRDNYGATFLKCLKENIVGLDSVHKGSVYDINKYDPSEKCVDLGSFDDYVKNHRNPPSHMVPAKDVPYGTVARLEKCDWIGVVIWENLQNSPINRRLLPFESGFVKSGIYLDSLHNLEILGKMEVSLEK